jgi:long-chain fatty acid transport protein
MVGRTRCSVRSLLWTGAALLVLAATAPASASGFSVARFASEHGHPLTDNATAAYYNPAALTFAREGRVFVDGTFALRRTTYTRDSESTDASAPADALDANSGRATLTNLLVGPALGVSLPLGRLTVAIGWFTPFGAPVAWDERKEYAEHPRLPGPVDGVQRWHSIEGQLYTSYLAFAAGYRVIDELLSLGAAFNVLGSLIEDVRARGDGTNDVEREGRALLEASGLAFSVAAGVVYQAVPETLWLGASYQSRPNLSGGLTLHGEARGYLGTTARSDVDVTYDLPDVLRVGARYRPERSIELRLFGDYTRYSAFERQCIRFAGGACRLNADGSQRPGSAVLQNLPRTFRDSFGVRAGVSLFTRSGLELFSGAGFESSAAPDATLMGDLPDFASVSFALGARHELLRGLRAAASFTQFLFVPRSVKSELARYAVPSKQPDASGHYTQTAGALNVNVELCF